MSKKEAVLGTGNRNSKALAIAGIAMVAGLYALFMSLGTPAQGVSAGGQYVSVDLAGLTTTVKFYEYTSKNGVKVQFMVVNGTDGQVHAALDTCEVCYASGKGYYTQDGEWIVCGNCGRRFHINNIGAVRGGCNPVPVGFEIVENELRVNTSELDAKDAYFRY